MKLELTVASLLLCLGASMAHAQGNALPPPPGTPDLSTNQAQASYAIGMDIGGSLRSQGWSVDLNLLMRGLADAFAGRQKLLTDQQAEAAMRQFQQEMAGKAAEKNKQEGTAFLAANKQQPGVVALPSGLQYQVIKQGSGATPTATDQVRTHYRGTLIDGTEFDSSIGRGEPAVFGVNQVIPGWTEALMRMKVGDKWRLFVPSELAYGERGAGDVIGPNSVLIFEVELLNVEK